MTSLTRARFEELCSTHFRKTIEPVEKVLRDAGMSKSAIHEIVLVGGSTLIPGVRKKIGSFFQKPPNIAIDPYKVVAIGAGIQGHLLAGGERDFLLLDVVPGEEER